MRHTRGVFVGLGLALALATPARAGSLGDLARTYVNARMSSGSAAVASARVPSFARQTGLACSACHYQFLTLTPYGRRFKLNGYTLSTRQQITEKDSTNGGKLNLSPFSLLSAMATASLTHLSDTLPGTQNDAAALPQELSVFIAGQITSKIGLFSQFTYSGADGSFGIDNLDFRYANKTELGGKTDMVYGLTLHNNPTVQDLWNTTPAWGVPFIGSEGAPGGIATPVVDGAFSQNVLGLGAYSLIAKTVYGEVSVYRSAHQGHAAPDTTTGAISGVAPYWRLALQKEWEHQYLMLGTYGMHASLFPVALTGPKNSFTDVGVDAQFETKAGNGNVVARGTWIHEDQTLDATFASGGSTHTDNTLQTFRLNVSYYPIQLVGVTAGYFQTTGSTDSTLYAPAPVVGSANGDPKTNGFVGEVDFNPWENARVGLQYTAYDKFNGGTSNYDGSGRNASGNNTLYLFMWLAF